MRYIDQMLKCHCCTYYQPIYYSNGSCGCGCLAYNMESIAPVDIINIPSCPLKDEKK